MRNSKCCGTEFFIVAEERSKEDQDSFFFNYQDISQSREMRTPEKFAMGDSYWKSKNIKTSGVRKTTFK